MSSPILQRSPNFQCMLAYNGNWTIDDIKFPVLVTPKLDGVRCFIMNGQPWSRSCKRIVNRRIREILTIISLNGCDGELYIPGLTFHEIQSIVMTEGAEVPNTFQYCIFDYVQEAPYWKRINYLDKFIPRFPWIKLITPLIADNTEKLDRIYGAAVEDGYEGLIIRSPDGPYKQGRSTLKESFMLKYVEWQTDEAICVDVIELQHNNETSTTQKSNMYPGETLGALIVDHKIYGQFKIGSGFSAQQRKEFWADPPLGELVTYKHKPHGQKDKPRTPIFLGIRKDL